MVWQAIEAVLVIFILIGVGVLVSWRGWVSRETAKVFPKLIIYLSLPCTVITSFTTHFTREQLAESWLPVVLIFAVVPVSFVIGLLAAKIFRIQKQRRGVFTVLFAFSNSVFIGFPVAQALFGGEGMPFAVYYYLANTTYFWLLGYYVIRRDADALSGQHSKITATEVLKKLVSAPIITIFVMVVVVLAGIRLPDLILTPAKYIGGMTSPLSLLFMGCTIYHVGLKGMKYQKGIGAVMLGRFLVIPALCFGVCMLATRLMAGALAGIDLTMMRNVFTMQIALPVMTQTVIISELYGADVEYATKGVVWTTLASLVTIPAYMVLFQYI